MTYRISIERIPYEEPYHVNLVWSVSNGLTSSTYKYYDNVDSLTKLSKELRIFPRLKREEFIYEVGSELPAERASHHFLFGVYHFGLRLRFSNNQPLPHRQLTEFCIEADTGSLDKLGIMLEQFSMLESNFLVWTANEDFVGDKQEYA